MQMKIQRNSQGAQNTYAVSSLNLDNMKAIGMLLKLILFISHSHGKVLIRSILKAKQKLVTNNCLLIYKANWSLFSLPFALVRGMRLWGNSWKLFTGASGTGHTPLNTEAPQSAAVFNWFLSKAISEWIKNMLPTEKSLQCCVCSLKGQIAIKFS